MMSATATYSTEEDAAVAEYTRVMGKSPNYIATAPGRVNLIGEHIDYNGFGVLPCAVAKYTVTAIGISSEDVACALNVFHVDSENFEGRRFDAVKSVPKEHHHWTNYVLAAYLGAQEAGYNIPKGVSVCISGDLPRASGLSSSSSLIVAALLAFARLSEPTNETLNPTKLAEICMRCEWHVGTAGGGMDQAAIILSKKGFATHITFDPLITTPIELPRGVAFIVANALARSAKAETLGKQYNRRFFECRIANIVLRKQLNLPPAADIVADTMATVLSESRLSFEQIIDFCKQHLPAGEVPKEEVVRLVGQENVETLLNSRCGRIVWDVNSSFVLAQRAIHTYSEANRVLQFVEACGSGDRSALARLMNQSNESCDVDYDCSCVELRELTCDMIAAGCTGARLTGAGWGGCAVGIVEQSRVADVITGLSELYYKQKMRLAVVTGEVLFAFEPAGGALCKAVEREEC
jgi:N-acetylgalactosamine kinase